MSAGHHTLNINQGATWSQTLVWKTGNAPKPVNLTSYTARLTLQPWPTRRAVVVGLTTENGGITLGGSAGTITLDMTAAKTTLLSPGEYKFLLEAISPGGRVTYILQDTLLVLPRLPL